MPPPANLDTMVDYTPGSARAWSAGWDYASARWATDEHLRGRFSASYQLGFDLNRHPAAMAARRQRRSSITALPWILRGPDRAPARLETEAAVDVWAQISAMLGEIEDDLAVMGLAVLQHPVEIEETETGPRYVIREVRQWPFCSVEHGSAIRADPTRSPYAPDRYYARDAHGRYHLLPEPGQTDLHWTVIGERGAPHRRGAIIACDLEYVAAQMSRRAWAKLQNMLGRTSIMGEMPPGTQMSDVDAAGNEGPTPIATDMLNMVSGVGETQVAGLHPAGAKVYTVQATATTADLLPQSIVASAQMFALALLGHDALLGKDIYTDPRAQTVPEDLARDDERLIKAPVGALLTGLARLNCERCAPITVDGQIPDSDQDMRREGVQKRRAADDKHRADLLEAGAKAAAQIAAERGTGALVDQDRAEYVYGLAGLTAPRMPTAVAPAPLQGAPAAPTPDPATPSVASAT